MAVTLTAAALAEAIRVGASPDETAQVERLLAVATALVVRHAPDAPGAIHGEAAIRVAGYLFDMPQAARGAGYADVLRNAGALALLLPWRAHRAGVADEGETTMADRAGVSFGGVVVGEPVIVQVGAEPAAVAVGDDIGRYLVRNRGPAVVLVAVAGADQTPGDGVRLAAGDATQVQVWEDVRIWLWTAGGGAEAAVVSTLVS